MRLGVSSLYWPMDIIAGEATGTIQTEEALADYLRCRHVLVIGASLGNYHIPVPKHVLSNVVVLLLRTFRGPKRYGYRVDPFISEQSSSWEGDTDMEPCDKFWRVSLALCRLGMCPAMNLLGMSAGVDKILSVVSTRHQYDPD
jgi:hypothetical protein